MTTDKAIEMVKAKLECITRRTSGKDKDCNNRRCDECYLNYEQGNMGKQKEWLRMSIEALEQESKLNKALNLLAEWAIECGFGYDNIPDEYVKYKDDIAEMGYTEGLLYIVKKESEKQYGRDKT